MNKSSIFFLIVSVAFTWFTFVFGGGAATGAQAYSLFAVHGWTSLWMRVAAIAIVAVVGWLCVDYANRIGAHHYREVIETLYRSKLVGTIYEIGCIYGTVLGLAVCFASLGSLTMSLGMNYWIGIFVMAAACTLGCLFGTATVRGISTVLGLVIGVIIVLIFSLDLGIDGGSAQNIIAEHEMFTSYSKAWYGCFYFAASNCGTMLALLPVFDRVKSRKRLTCTIAAGFVLNILMFCMVIYAVLNSMPGVNGAQVPYLYVIQSLGIPGLANIYIVILAAAVVTTGITLLYTYTVRFRKYVKVKSDRLSAFIILTAFEFVGAVISKFGLITLVSKGMSLTVWINIIILIIGVPIMYFIRTRETAK